MRRSGTVSEYYDTVERLLPQVSKPSRYLGSEVNAVHKDLGRIRLKFALAFPDIYEIGMSHLGFRILYHLLNRRPEVAAERFFCPWTDLELLMRQRGIPLFSQESRTPLNQFDIIGFSVPYEMGYSNVLNMLGLGGVPLETEARREAFPLVIAGGPCAVNPEPLAPFFDAFVVGDGEEVLDEILNIALRAKEDGWTKEQILVALAGLEGLYIPSFFLATYGEDGALRSAHGTLPGYDRVVRRIAPSLERLAFPTDLLVPYTRVIHDRVSLEIARGCTRGCRFCQAGFTYRPVRERSPERVLELAQRSLRETGYEELSLLSLSSGDYTCISELMQDLMVRYAPEKVAVSLPSLRIGSLSDEIMEMVKEVRKTGITLAPEAGTERLRRVINKDVEEEEILETARRVFTQGWLSLKLYFMIGLPTETEEDLEGIVGLCRRILKEIGPRQTRRKISVSLSTFVPKPHTPFQWASQLPLAETQERLEWLKRRLRRLGFQVKWQEPKLSLLEGAFSRGDRRLAAVLKRATELGCRFDGWREEFCFERWEQAFREVGIPLEAYAVRAWSPQDVLAWDHIDVGIAREYLLEECNRAMAGQRTPDCRGGECTGCAVCDQESVSIELADSGLERPPFPGMKAFQGIYHRSRGRERSRKFRVRYAKHGPARFLSHLELTSVLVRALRRGAVPLKFSQGYHPMPRVDFGPALPVGVESLGEHFDFESFGYLEPREILEALERALPEGIQPLACEEIDRGASSLFEQPARTRYRVRIPAGMGPAGKALQERVETFYRRPTFVIRCVRKGRERELDLKKVLLNARVEPPRTLHLEAYAGTQRSIRLVELLGSLLDLEEGEVRRLHILKTETTFLEASQAEALERA